MTHLSLALTNGDVLTLSHVVDRLSDAGFPADSYIDAEAFKKVLMLVLSQHIHRDEEGIYVDVVRCRVRPAR